LAIWQLDLRLNQAKCGMFMGASSWVPHRSPAATRFHIPNVRGTWTAEPGAFQVTVTLRQPAAAAAAVVIIILVCIITVGLPINRVSQASVHRGVPQKVSHYSVLIERPTSARRVTMWSVSPPNEHRRKYDMIFATGRTRQILYRHVACYMIFQYNVNIIQWGWLSDSVHWRLLLLTFYSYLSTKQSKNHKSQITNY